ncbi:MAG: HEAT repeat domain-containing protein, partial [Planctomycetes bacterium]|nr:HEAT repeat domain-containing protein [Planctomycetota bacterium]
MGLALAACCLAAQTDLSALIEKLKSDAIEEREAAVGELKKLGPSAVPALEKAVAEGEPEVKAQLEWVCRVITLRETLPANLLKEMQGIEDRLAGTDAHAWTEAMFEALREDESGKRIHPTLGRRELDALVGGAVRGCGTLKEADDLRRILRESELPSAGRHVQAWLKNEDSNIRAMAIRLLQDLLVGEAIPEIRGLLKDPDADVRGRAAHFLGKLHVREAIPDLVALLKDPDGFVHGLSYGALEEMRAKEAIPELCDLLKNHDVEVRLRAVGLLQDLQARSAVAQLLPLVGDGDEEVARKTIYVLDELEARVAVPQLRLLVNSRSAGIRDAAARLSISRGNREIVPDLIAMLSDPERRGTAVWALGSFR